MEFVEPASDFESKSSGNHPVEERRQVRQGHSNRTRTPRAYRFCDAATEALLYFMLIFSPWAFGTTREWAIWVMNIGGYLLGGLVLAKLLIRRNTGYQPARWRVPEIANKSAAEIRPRISLSRLTAALAAFTIVLLSYCLVSALNARATLDHNRFDYVYRDCIKWLPHSYSSSKTWFAFWAYLGLAFSFWATRDWLLGKTRRERHLHNDSGQGNEIDLPRISTRLKRLLWVLSINGALLGVEAILQRLSGTNKLLWWGEPPWNTTPDAQFGVYAYRSNAAQYFNLIWPVSLGLWWELRRSSRNTLKRAARFGGGSHLLLLPFVAIVAASPIISTSRGGAFIAGANGVLAMLIFSCAGRREKWQLRAAIPLICVLTLGLGGYLGWAQLTKRLSLDVPIITQPTDYKIGTNDLTLRCSFLVPAANSSHPQGLIGLSESEIQLEMVPNSLQMFVTTDGSLRVRLYGNDITNTVEKSVNHFIADYHGQSVEVEAARSSDLTVFINGKRADVTQASTGTPPGWNSPVASAYLWVGRLYGSEYIFEGPIRAATFFNWALDESKIQSIRQSGLGDSERIKAKPVHFEDVSEILKPGALNSDGTSVIGNVDNINGSDGWLKIERTVVPGPLALQPMDPRFNLTPGKTVRVTFSVYNPNESACYIASSWNGFFGKPQLVPAKSSRTITDLYSSNATPGNFGIAITDSLREVRRDVAVGQSFYVRDLMFEQIGAVVDLDLSWKLRAGLLTGHLGGRTEIYNIARRMAQDYPAFGTGPGTFASLYKFYRDQSNQNWAAYAHNDWLETRITFGWVGVGLILSLLLLVFARWFAGGGIPMGWPFVAMMWLALGGCLIHARFDFPFQIHSLVFLFLIECAILFSCSRKL
ncbi:MAG: O-antigen ligase family protein [Verrucomicrobiota bacterium]